MAPDTEEPQNVFYWTVFHYIEHRTMQEKLT